MQEGKTKGKGKKEKADCDVGRQRGGKRDKVYYRLTWMKVNKVMERRNTALRGGHTGGESVL